MIKILSACGAGINTSHQIKNAIEEEMEKRGHNVSVTAVMIKDITEDMLNGYDMFTPISAPDFAFDIKIPVVEAGAILYKIDAMSKPVFDEIEQKILDIGK